MIIGILAILKAGGAYIPLDPNTPPERLLFMLEDTKIKLLLTQGNIDQSWPTSLEIIDLDRDENAIAQESLDSPFSQTIPEHLAYVMYTSGSTGIPKGVCIPHRGVIRLVKQSNYIELSPDHVFLQAAPYTFDASTLEIWGALLNGGRLVILPSQTPSLEELGQAIEKYQVTTLWLTAGLFHLMVEERLESFKNVRKLLAGGDVLSPPHVQTVLQTYPYCRVINGYGPTENTTFTCCYTLTNAEQIGHSVPIGRPINHTQVYILDPYLQPVPFGVPGELYVGGEGLARGYLNRPQLTAETFIPNPFVGKKQGERLYKTGDRVRYRTDGNIEFLGRRDNQVKVRGFRIELGEIEAVLNQHPQVQEAIAVVRETSQNHKQLVAYAVPITDTNLSIPDLQTFLAERLPDYLHPTHWVILDAFPLTPNGKVDRRSLPLPVSTSSESVTPRTPIETQLAEIWKDVLNLEKVGVEDNFFELGGDSILAIQIISRANRIGLKLSPKQLFQHQTITKLAAIATRTKSPQSEQGIVTGSVPLTPIQHWFFQQNLPKIAHFNQSAFLEVSQPLDFPRLQQVFSYLLKHHDALRLRFERTESGWQQVIISPNEEVPLTQFDLSGLTETAQDQAIAVTATQLQGSLNLSTGPLLRIAVFDLGISRPNQLLIIIHHLAVDGISWRILLEDLRTAYQQLEQNQPIQVPMKSTSIKTWAEKLPTYPAQQEQNYWRSLVKKSPILLPIDYPGGKNTVATTEQVIVTLGEEPTQSLLKKVPKAYNTQINEVLLTALVETFAQWTGKRYLLINLEGHGREDIWDNINLSRTVGWFTTLFPIFLDLEQADSLLDALIMVRDQLRRIPHQGMGYGILRYLQDEKDIITSAQVSFNYLGQFDALLSESSRFRLSSHAAGLHQNPNQPRPHLLEINGSVKDGQLRFVWTYSRYLYRQSTIEAIAQGFIETLEQLIDCCQFSDVEDEIFSDISLANLDQDTLNQVLGMVNFDA
ncbi:MAG: amino acid adenylation domain-containing protein, partial [Cyanobacteria bacterium P01_G01_bin.49]